MPNAYFGSGAVHGYPHYVELDVFSFSILVERHGPGKTGKINLEEKRSLRNP